MAKVLSETRVGILRNPCKGRRIVFFSGVATRQGAHADKSVDSLTCENHAETQWVTKNTHTKENSNKNKKQSRSGIKVEGDWLGRVRGQQKWKKDKRI